MKILLRGKHIPVIALLSASFVLGGCQLWPSKDEAETQPIDQIEGPTVGSLEQRQINIAPQALEPMAVEQSLASYQQILQHSDDPEARQRVLRRMADLTMIAAENQLISQVKEQEQEQKLKQQAQGADVKISEYEQRYLDIGYENAIKLYENFLASGVEGAKRAETYYLLAKVYDLMGEIERSLEMLNKLVLEHPESAYYQEAQFRRGEILFSDGDFRTAADAYHQILARRNNDRFYEQALYKYGWSHFKLTNYQQSVTIFFQLLDHLVAQDNLLGKSKTSNKISNDTQRVISLAFSHLDGPQSVKQFFQQHGGRDYEAEIYASLSELYLKQERYKDASETYETFITVHPLHPLAPDFQSAIIASYTQGGFPSLVLPAKEDYIARFGAQSEYWDVYHKASAELYGDMEKETLARLKPELKKHLWDVASHYHALAQASKIPNDFLRAAIWYEQLLGTFIHDPDARKVNLLLAESYFSGQQYQQAIIEFNHSANDYGGDPQENANASYFALVSYQKLITDLQKNQVEEREINDWIKQKVDHGIHYAKRYDFDPRVPQILDAVRIDQLHLKDVAAAVSTSRWLVSLPNLNNLKLQKSAWETIANGEFDLAHFPEAEYAYGELLKFPGYNTQQRTTFKEQQVASIYKQAEMLLELDQPLAAAEQFIRVGQTYPNSKIRPNAEFDAANIYIEEKSWPEAINILTRFRQLYPQHQLADTIPDKLALAYESSAQWALASVELETISDRYRESNGELSRQSLWHAAELRDKAEDPVQAIRVYKKYVWAFETPLEQRAEGQYRLAQLYQQTGDANKRSFWLNKLVDNYKTRGDENNDRTLYLAAWASYSLAEPLYERFRNSKLTAPLKNSLKTKQQAMKKSVDAYSLVLEIGVADFTTASTYKIGEIYRTLAVDLMASERPPSLNELELDQYEILLEEQALPFEDQAIEIHESNVQLVLKAIYDQWVRKSYTALRSLLPARYAKDEKSEQFIDEIL